MAGAFQSEFVFLYIFGLQTAKQNSYFFMKVYELYSHVLSITLYYKSNSIFSCPACLDFMSELGQLLRANICLFSVSNRLPPRPDIEMAYPMQ